MEFFYIFNFVFFKYENYDIKEKVFLFFGFWIVKIEEL